MSQSWTKAHDSSKNNHWINFPSTDSPIVDDEMNRNEVSVDTIDDRVLILDTVKAEQSDLLLAFKDVSLNSNTGVITFTLFNNTTKTIDTLLEKIAINFDYDDDPTSPHYQNLIIELEDGTYKYIDMSALITEYEFTDTGRIAFTVGNDGSVSADIVDGSITGAKLQPNYLADCVAAKTGAEYAEANAIAKALVSEGWAKGTQNGTPVGSTSPYYHNNAEYFKDQASQIAGGSIGGLSDVDIDSLSLATGQALIYNSTSQMWENKDLIRPHIIVISDTGSIVTVTKGTTVIATTETSTGQFECDVTEFGTWTIDAVLGGDDAQVSLVVDTVKVYTIDDRHFHADITVTFPSGGTCSCSKSGETTLYANTNPYTFTVHTSGTWTITATGNGETYTESVNVTTSGQTTSLTIPVGSTVTPTDSVATLLSCAGIDDTSITTLADLFADSTTLLAVISSNNAIDYLVRSTTFANDVTANSTAMTDIGTNNYASNTLLDNSTWCTAICNSTYFESVLNAKVPTMTSNTEPSGVAFANQEYDNRFYAYRSLSNSPTITSLITGQSGTWGYKFTNSVRVCKFITQELGNSNEVAPQSIFKNAIIQGSNDGNNWTSIYTIANATYSSNMKFEYSFPNSNAFTYYRLNISSNFGHSAYTEIGKLAQFYGRVDV